MLDSYTLLGALAARTSRVRLGTMVTGVTYRNPAHLAKIVTTLDVISAGRAILGIGAAWYDVEHEGLGFDFPPAGERLDRLEEALQICRGHVHRGGADASTGRYYRIHEARNVPASGAAGRAAHPGRRRRGEADAAAGGALRRHVQHLRRRRHDRPQGRGAARALRGGRARPVRGHGQPAEHAGAHRQRGGDGDDQGLPAPGHGRGAARVRTSARPTSWWRRSRSSRPPVWSTSSSTCPPARRTRCAGSARCWSSGSPTEGRRRPARYSTRRSCEVAVLAAIRPGMVATRTASAMARSPIATMVPTGTVG